MHTRGDSLNNYRVYVQGVGVFWNSLWAQRSWQVPVFIYLCLFVCGSPFIFPGDTSGTCLPMQETQEMLVQSLGQEYPQEDRRRA